MLQEKMIVWVFCFIFTTVCEDQCMLLRFALVERLQKLIAIFLQLILANIGNRISRSAILFLI